jgi:hypothetical protein
VKHAKHLAVVLVMAFLGIVGLATAASASTSPTSAPGSSTDSSTVLKASFQANYDGTNGEFGGTIGYSCSGTHTYSPKTGITEDKETCVASGDTQGLFTGEICSGQPSGTCSPLTGPFTFSPLFWDSDYNGVQAQQWTFTFDEIGKTGAFKMHIVAYY